MAIHPLSPAPIDPTPPNAQGFATSGITLAIPLDVNPEPQPSTAKARRAAAASTERRDSLKRREALLRGKEGSRRRQRWENDRLLSNPHAVPPSAADWEPRPLHSQKHVPYEFASLWDTPAFQKRHQRNVKSKQEVVDKVPRELKARLKRSHAAVDLLHVLEEEVRKFILGEQKETSREMEHERPESPVHVNIEDVEDESDEEIVFISKKMRYQQRKQDMSSSVSSIADVRVTEKVLFESLLSDPSASFGRWLVHAIASYYDLKSWSVTTGNQRLAYIGFKESATSKLPQGVPKPLYLML